MDDLQPAKACLEWLEGQRAPSVPKRPRFAANVAREALSELVAMLDTGEVRTKLEDAEAVVESIYQAYPRKADKGHAEKAIRAAIKKLGKKWQGDEKASALWLWQRVREYADSPAVKKGVRDGENFVPYCATWMNGERYHDPASEWGYTPRELAMRKYRSLPADEQERIRREARERYPNTTDVDGAIVALMRE